LPVVVISFAEDKKPTGMKLSLTLMKSFSMTNHKSMLFFQALWIKLLMTNHGVSENSRFSTKPLKSAPFSILNAIIKELPSNFAVNQRTSDKTIFPQPLDQSKFLLKAESLSIKRMTLTARLSPIPKVNHALRHLSFHYSKLNTKPKLNGPKWNEIVNTNHSK